MREYLSSEDICNQMSMMRSVFDGTFLIVEGVTDQRLFEKFIDKDDVRIIQAHSKDKVRTSVRTMSDRRRDRMIIGIMDPDLELVNNRKVSPPLFYTDCRDMEMMLFRSNAFNDLVDEYVDMERMHELGFDSSSLREAVVDASSNIGTLMKISMDTRMNLCFKDLDFFRFINPRTLDCDVRTMIDEVVANTTSRKHSRSKVFQAFLDEPEYDPWIIARGHDTVDVLLVALKRGIGSFNAKYLNEGELSGALRLAFSDQDFMDTNLYASTQDWSEKTGNSLWDMVTRSRTDV